MKKLVLVLIIATLLTAFCIPSMSEQGEIVIGGITDLTGPGSVLGTACNYGWQLAVEHVNAAGGVNGHKLELISYDTKSNPQEALAAYDRLVNVDNAAIVVGPPFSNIGLALADTVDEMKVAFFGQFGDPRCMLGESLDSLHPYMFLVQPSAIDTGIISGAYPVEKFGMNKVAMLIAQDHAYCSTQAKAFMEYAKEKAIEVVAVEYCPTKDTDLTIQLTAIKNSGAQFLFNATNTNLLAIACQQMYQMGIDILQCGSLDFSNPFNTLVDPPEAASNIYFPVNLDMEAPEMASITAEYLERFGVSPTPKSWIAYDTILVCKAAIEKAGASNATAIRDALESISGVKTLITENFSINPDTHMPLNLQMCIYNLENGVYTNKGWYYPAN